jgi:hypothetical protein
MEHKSGYIITPKNSTVVSHISGIELPTIEANLGWVALYEEFIIPRWSLVPESVAKEMGYIPVQTRLDEGPHNSREIEEIEAEMFELDRVHHKRRRELERELQRRIIELNDPS